MTGRGTRLIWALGDGAKGALGADDHAGHVEGLSLFVVRGGGPRVHEVFEVVAADAADNLGVAGLDFVAVGLGDVDDATVYLRLQGVAGELALKLGGVDAAETGAAAVGEDGLDLHDVVDGLAVNHRVGATGVVADATANAGAVGTWWDRGHSDSRGSRAAG